MSVCEWGSRTLVCLCCLGRISSFLGTGQELDIGDIFGHDRGSCVLPLRGRRGWPSLS